MRKISKTRRACLAFLFGSCVLLASALAALLFTIGISNAANAAKTVEVWPYPQTQTVSGTGPLICPGGYKPLYSGTRTALLGWRSLPPSTKPQVHRAPGRVCLDRDGGHPFYEHAYTREVIDTDPCVFCVLGAFQTPE